MNQPQKHAHSATQKPTQRVTYSGAAQTRLQSPPTHSGKTRSKQLLFCNSIQKKPQMRDKRRAKLRAPRQQQQKQHDAGSKLFGGISSVLSVAVQPNRVSFVFTCFSADMATCWMLCSSSPLLLTPRIHSNILKFVLSLISISLCSRSVSCSGVE